MKWKKKSNLIILIILSIAYICVTFLNIIGPLHMNKSGAINTPGLLSVFSFLYLLVALLVTWVVYFLLRKKPEALFFILILLGIVIIVVEVFIWGSMGS